MTDPLGCLSTFNDEEWADRPYTIELRGGCADGDRLTVRELPWMWRVPEPVNVGELFTTQAPLSTAEPSFRAVDYRRTGKVTDDGAHVYECERFQ